MPRFKSITACMRTCVRAALVAASLLLNACGAIPAKAPGAADALERHTQLAQALDGAPLLAGNQVELLRDGAEALPAMFRAIAAARDHVNLEFYGLEDVQVPGQPGSLFTLLAELLRAGVAVTILYDSFGSADTPAISFATLRQLGARVLAFNPLHPFQARRHWAPNNRDHRKVLIVDGRIAFMGGINLARVYEAPCHTATALSNVVAEGAGACWRDTSLRLQGPAVAALQQMFLNSWAAQEGEALPPRNWFPSPASGGTAQVRILASAPGAGPPRYYITLMTALGAAQQRIWASTGFFVPTHAEREALADAARRGVDVRLVLPAWTDMPFALEAGQAAYDDLLEAGVQIFEMRRAVLHSKLVVVDGAWSAIGSSNLDRRSIALNDEVDAIILGRGTASATEAVLAEDMAGATSLTLAGWRARSLVQRAREWRARLLIDFL